LIQFPVMSACPLGREYRLVQEDSSG
jgi:hypothetical protein